jgi:two-component system sensor histidine kinase FlrB
MFEQKPIQAEQSAQQLEVAFHAFNAMSESLEASYRDLESQVIRLHQELAAANSERLRELAAREQIANRLERLLEALPGGVLVLDGNGVIRDCNPAAIDLLDEPLLGVSWSEVRQRAFEPNGWDGDEVVLRDGRRVSISLRSLGSEPGRIVLLKDVTETRRLQEMVARQQRLSAMGEMAASLAHQIRTPLASSLLYISNLGRPHLDGAGRIRFVERVRERLRHMERMVNDMLVFARGGSSEGGVVTVSSLVDDLLHTIEPQLADCGGAINHYIGGSDGSSNDSELQLVGNHEALLGALLNLATNSIQAGGDGVEIALEVRSVSGAIEILLSDNGPGVADDIADSIFDPFYTTRPDGTGLGLAVVRNVVEAHGGQISLLDRGEGASFRILLPCAGERQALLSGGGEETVTHLDGRGGQLLVNDCSQSLTAASYQPPMAGGWS